MHTGKIEGFFGLAQNGSQYQYEAEYSSDDEEIHWSARILLDDDVKGTPSGTVHAHVMRIDQIEHHVRDIVTSSITSYIGAEP